MNILHTLGLAATRTFGNRTGFDSERLRRFHADSRQLAHELTGDLEEMKRSLEKGAPMQVKVEQFLEQNKDIWGSEGRSHLLQANNNSFYRMDLCYDTPKHRE